MACFGIRRLGRAPFRARARSGGADGPGRSRRRALASISSIASIAAAIAGAGCENLRSGALPDTPPWLHHPGGAMSIWLRRSITAEARQVGEQYERGQPAIDVAHRRVFVGSSDRGLYALRAEDGATLWRFETLGAVQSEPLYDPVENVVYFGSNDGALYKVTADLGTLLWRFSTNAEVARRPVLHEGVVYAVNANDTIVALDAKTGAMRWTQHRTPAFGMEIAGYAGPAVWGDKVYTAFSDGVVLAYSLANGAEAWQPVDLAAEAEQAAGGQAPRYLDVDTTPIVARTRSGVVVFVASYSGGVFALDAQDGSRAWVNEKALGVTELTLWTQPAHPPRSGKGPPVPERSILFASSGPTGLWAIDPNDGRTLWRRDLPEGGITAPTPIAGALLVGTTRYGIFLFSPLDGSLIDGIETGGGFAMTPAAYGTRAFMMSNGGAFVGIHVVPPPIVLRGAGG